MMTKPYPTADKADLPNGGLDVESCMLENSEFDRFSVITLKVKKGNGMPSA
jgi:hypothetical protein